MKCPHCGGLIQVLVLSGGSEVDKNGVGVDMGVDICNINWQRSNGVIAAELGLSSQKVSVLRRKLGKPKATRWNLAFQNADWSKTNEQLAGEIGCASHTVKYWRDSLQKPRSSRQNWNKQKRLVTDEQIKAADWEFKTDVALSREWGISRERVRQIRARGKFPECRLKNWHDRETFQFAEWVERHRDTALKDKSGKEVIDAAPDEFKGSMSREGMRKVLLRLGFKVTRIRKPRKYPVDRINFALPNIALSFIWDAPKNVFGSMRYRECRPAPKWKVNGGFCVRFLSDPQFLDAVQREIEVAKQNGFTPREDDLKKWLEYRRELAHSTP